MWSVFSQNIRNRSLPCLALEGEAWGIFCALKLLINHSLHKMRGIIDNIFKGKPWWHHQMETFSALLALCVRNSSVTGEFPSQRPVTQSFDVFFDLRLNKWLSKQSWGWWFETPSCSFVRHCNDHYIPVSKGKGILWFYHKLIGPWEIWIWF